MAHEKLLSEFVEKMRTAAGENLISMILYGSAAEGEFHPEYSDLNLLCVLRDTSFASLSKIASAVEWWRKKKYHPPLVLTPQELKDTADVFSIEFVDMKQRHRVLYGEDVLRNLDVPMHLHRSQLEYELREKLFLLRQHILVAATREKDLWEVMLNSLTSFTTLFRHVLIELGEQGRKHSREAVHELASRLNFDSSAFVQLMDVRAKKSDRKQLRADLIPNLVETVKGITKQEQTVFGEIAQARSQLLSASTPADKIAANQHLDGALGRLLAIAENYPQLKSNENFLRLQDELAGTENRIAVERKRYNDTLQDYNTYVQQFPNNIFAQWAGFKPNNAYFAATEGSREVPKVNFSAPNPAPQPAPAK